jgi:hypothetical protein
MLHVLYIDRAGSCADGRWQFMHTRESRGGGPPLLEGLLEGLDAGRLGGGAGEAARSTRPCRTRGGCSPSRPKRCPRALGGPVVLGADEGDTVVELLAAAG